MDEGRLKAVRRGQRLHRKFAYAMNDTIRNRQDLYASCLSREEQEANKELVKDVMRVKRAVVRSKVLLHCLRVHKQSPIDRARSEPILGKYGGRPIESFTRDIDQHLAWFHPRLKRLRKVDRIKQTCLRQGAILDEDTVKERMEDFFARSLPRMSPEQRLSPINTKGAKTAGRHPVYDDDDDFDIRDFPDFLGGAEIKLKLHPFGNNVDLNIGARTSESPLGKYNVFRAKSKSPTKSLASDIKPGLGATRHAPVNPVNSTTNTRQVTVNTKDSTLSMHHGKASGTVDQPPQRLTKYSNPLPSIRRSVSPSKDGHDVNSVPAPSLETDGQRRASGQSLDKVTVSTTSDDGQRRASGQSLDKVTVSTTSGDGQRRASGQSLDKVTVSTTSGDGDRPGLTRRKTLILPPIETSKQMMKRD